MHHWRNQKGNQKIPRDKWKHSSKREVYTNTILSQEIKKISNKQLNLTPQTTRERSLKNNQS